MGVDVQAAIRGLELEVSVAGLELLFGFRSENDVEMVMMMRKKQL